MTIPPDARSSEEAGGNPPPDGPPVDRAAEVAAIEAFFGALPGGSRCLVLQGEMGIGKTTLLQWGRAAARRRGHLVLSASPVEMEVPWEFAALADLLEAVPNHALAALPAPQRQAIGVAVFRQAAGAEVDGRTLATGVLGTLRLVAETTPVLLVVDDLPLLDLPSARVLSYVLRRAADAPIGLLGAVRLDWSGDPVTEITGSIDPARVARLTVGPVSLDGMRTVLGPRADALGRTGVARLYQRSRGNLLFALELVDADGGAPDEPGGAGPEGVPATLGPLVLRRLRPLPASARDLLLVAALSTEPSLDVVLAAADPAAELAQVTGVGFLRRHGDDLAFAHPLIRTVVVGEATAAQRRDAHRRLAGVVTSPEGRARHRALGADGPDEVVAAQVEEAATTAAARGAGETAALLAGLSVSLTPPDRVAARQRRLAFHADTLFEASEPARACTQLEEVVGAMAPGPARAELLRRLARYSAFRGDPLRMWIARLTTALDEAGDDPALRAAIAFDLATSNANAGRGETATGYYDTALSLAEQAGDASLAARISGGAAFCAFRLGHGVRHDLVERALSEVAQPPRLSMELRPRVAVAWLRHLSGDLGGARALYEQEWERAQEEGIETGLPMLLWGLAETEVWAGRWDRAAAVCEEGCTLAEDSASSGSVALMTGVRAMVHACRGRIDEAVRDGEACIELAASIGFPVAVARGAQALGIAGLSVGDAAGVHARLGPVADFVLAVGIREPGILHFLPDEIEARIRLGQLDGAAALLDPFEAGAADLDRTWGLAAAGRCRGLLQAAGGDLAAAQASLDAALAHHRALDMPLELGRTLVVAGEIGRRARRKKQARQHLEAAVGIFTTLGAPCWAERARQELARLGLGAAAGSELTDAERAVADLVVAGLTNAQVAARLFMAQRTVEAHLQRVYRKLEVHSRTQLSLVHRPGPP